MSLWEIQVIFVCAWVYQLISSRYLYSLKIQHHLGKKYRLGKILGENMEKSLWQDAKVENCIAHWALWSTYVASQTKNVLFGVLQICWFPPDFNSVTVSEDKIAGNTFVGLFSDLKPGQRTGNKWAWRHIFFPWPKNWSHTYSSQVPVNLFLVCDINKCSHTCDTNGA